MRDPTQVALAIASLPLPLAQTLRRAVNAKSVADQHLGAYYFFESTLKLAAAAQIGAYVQVGCPDTGLNKQLETPWCSIIRPNRESALR